MKNKEAKDLLAKYKMGTLKGEENAQLETWYLHLLDKEEVSLNESDMEQRLDAVWKKLNHDRISPLKIKSFPWMRIAAAAIVTIFIGTLFYLNRRNHSPINVQVKYSADIMPGGNKAMLTLANGQKVILSDFKSGAITKQGGIIINKSSDGNVVYQTTGSKTFGSVSINTLSTPRGGQYHLTLTDGTNVWLNSGSTITYPTFFTGKTRNVKITGEVYFEVAKNKKQPFMVTSGKQVVEVLGTHFNINAYEDEAGVKTTLLEGSVKVYASSGADLRSRKGIVLTPGEQALTKSNNTGIQVTNADIHGVVAWKNGLFYFKNADIESVMRQFARWYDVEVIYEGKLPSRAITGKIYRNVTASQALSILNYLNIHFKIEHTSKIKRIIIIP